MSIFVVNYKTKMERERHFKIDTIEDLNQLFQIDSKCRQVSLIDVTSKPVSLKADETQIGFYAVYVKVPNEELVQLKKGQNEEAAANMTMLAPGSTVRDVVSELKDYKQIIGLFFSPDLIAASTFGRHFSEYTFFQYNHEESLLLGENEKDIILAIFKRIYDELQGEEDRNTLHILTDQVKLVLDYCLRFYDRQFNNRHNQNYLIAQQFLQNISLYFNNGTAKLMGVPTISYFADLAHTSPGYFSDIIKKETGVNIKKYIQYKIIEAAKQLLAATDKPINEISEWLGFKYPQHFTRLFKHEAGMSPRAFRKQRK